MPTDEPEIPVTDRSLILVGWGDVVYYAIRPMVLLQDWAFGTDLAHCDKCKKRRYDWNQAFHLPNPFKRYN